MDATTPPRGDDEPTAAQPTVPPPLTEPGQPQPAAGSTAADAPPAEQFAQPAPEPRVESVPESEPAASAVVDDGPEDPSVPDTAVEATLEREAAGSNPDEPVVPTAQADQVEINRDADPDEPVDDLDDQPGAVAEPVPASAHVNAGAGYAGAAGYSAAEGAAPGAPQREIVYVAAPHPPKRKGNRGTGALIALLSAVIFLVVYVLFILILQPVFGGSLDTDFLRNPRFYIPVVLFAIAFVLLALVVNRGGWWAFVLGSLFVGMVTYFGTIGVLLLLRAAELTPETAELAFRQLLVSPTVIVAGLVAREVALWAGAAISARGRRVNARNAEARAEFDRDEAERRAEIEQNGAVIRERVSVR
jgi:hypothetical protein